MGSDGEPQSGSSASMSGARREQGSGAKAHWPGSLRAAWENMTHQQDASLGQSFKKTVCDGLQLCSKCGRLGDSPTVHRMPQRW